MLWISAALGTAILVAIANIIDSHVLSKKMPGLSSFLVPLAVMQFIIAAVFFVAFPFPAGIHLPHLLAAFGAALCNAFSLIITLNCLKHGEVSRIIPVTSSSPIFVALLSMPLLGERLNYWQWLAVVITVYGAVLVSLHHNGSGEKTRLQKSFFLLLFAALLTAVSSVGYKYALETMTSWNMVSINAIFVVVIVLVISLRKATLLELKHLPQRTRTFGLIACSQTVVYIGVTLGFIAIANGPVALVLTIMNIRPAFVFLFSLLLSLRYPNFLNERLDKQTILYKVFGIVLITGGVAIIGLFN